jgi:sialic acid synthase SpsE
MKARPVDKDALVNHLSGMKDVFEKSVVSLSDIPAGTIITAEMIGIKKPGTGIPAKNLYSLIGKRAAHFIPKDTLLKENDLDA